MAEFIDPTEDTKDESFGETLKEIAKRIATENGTETVDENVNISDFLAAKGLRLVHIRPNGSDYSVLKHRGMTVIWQRVNTNVVQIATAVVHPNDQFTKRTGALVAIQHWLDGKTCYLPIHRKNNVAQTLRYLLTE